VWLEPIEPEDLEHTVQLFDAEGIEKYSKENLKYGDTASFVVEPMYYDFLITAYYDGEVKAVGKTGRTINAGANEPIAIKMEPPDEDEEPASITLEGEITIGAGSLYAVTGVVLTAIYSGTETGLSFQWYCDEAAVPEADSPVHTPETAGSYTVTVSLAGYDSKTSPAVIVVDPGTGVLEDPFIVYNVATLQKVGAGTDGWTLEAHYRQMGNIDLSGIDWMPIGPNETEPFAGTYNGGGFNIENLTINNSTGDYQGLFGFVSGADSSIANINMLCEIVL